VTGWQWVFRSRQTGRVSIASWPNVPLWIWIATAVARRMPYVHGPADTALTVAGSVALVVWAVGELWRGVNPWRRLLGLAVLLSMVLSAAR
jgi:type IV secretory pathway VirB2 component (pilin)